jgi:hypothetical protein
MPEWPPHQLFTIQASSIYLEAYCHPWSLVINEKAEYELKGYALHSNHIAYGLKIGRVHIRKYKSLCVFLGFMHV